MLVRNHQSLRARTFNIKVFDHRTGPCNGMLEELLVDLLGVLRSLLQETFLANFFDVRLLWAWMYVLKFALVDEIATQLLLLVPR